MDIKEYYISHDPNHHWPQRKRERVDELFDIELPDSFYAPEDNREEIKAKLLTAIKQGLDKRISLFIHETDVEPEKYNMTILAIVDILRNGKVYKPVLRAMSTTGDDSAENSGNAYVAYTKDNALYTLYLVPESNATKEFLTRKEIRHQSKKGIIVTSEDFAIHTKPNAAFKLSADHVLKAKVDEPVGRVTDPSQLPYKIRGDYRNSQPNQPSIFDHKDYGKGKIIASDKGMASTGIWDSITVQFPGLPQPKIFKKLYTTSYFRSLVKMESYLNALQYLTGKRVVLV